MNEKTLSLPVYCIFVIFGITMIYFSSIPFISPHQSAMAQVGPFGAFSDNNSGINNGQGPFTTNTDTAGGRGENQSQISTPPAGFLQYNNTKFGFGIQYPANWTIEEGDNFLFPKNDNNIVTIIPPHGIDSSGSYHMYLSITIDPNPASNLSTYLTNVINGYQTIKGFSLIDSNINTATIAGHPAYMLVYNSSGDFDSKTMEIATIIDNKGYYIDYQADPAVYDIYLPTIYKMISTLQTPFGQGATFGNGQQMKEPSSIGSNDTNNSKISAATGIESVGTNQQASNQTENLLQYNNTKFGFGIQYPAEAKVNETNTGVDFDFPNGNSASVDVYSSNNMTINQYNQYELGLLNKQFPDAKIINSTDVPLAGNPGHYVLFDANNTRYLIHWTVIGNKEYELIFYMVPATADNFISTTAINMHDSLQISEGSQGPFTPTSTRSSSSPIPNNSSSNGINLLPYKNPDLGFNIGYPSGWTVKESQGGVSFVRSSNPSDRIDVKVIENKTLGNMPLNQYADMKFKELRNEFKGFHVLYDNDTTIAGNSGHYLAFTFTNNSASVAATTSYTIIGDRVYEVQSFAPLTDTNNFVPILNSMKQSFQITRQNHQQPTLNNGTNSQQGIST